MASGKTLNNKKSKNRPKLRMADKADRHILYEKSVQCVESEIDFIDETFKDKRKREAYLLREDFCGTTNTSCEWIRRRKNNIAYSVDIDPDVLAWGKKNKIAKLNRNQTERIHVINGDVLTVETKPVDTVLAMNFSYWFFKDRPTMLKYFRRVHKGLVKDGIFFLDAFGGYEAYQELEERTKHNDFTYIWDQASYNPITGTCKCNIHFKFKDGSKMKKAFTYEWRLWSLPEVTELLTEAGFKPTVYWEGADEDGEGNGIFEPTMEGTADAGWIAYIVAEK
jgi:SAM-dependent methyltransferase